MLNATITAGRLKYVVSVLRRVHDEGIFEASTDGLVCVLGDANNAELVRVDVPSTVFERFEADTMRIGIDLEKLATKVLKRAAVNDSITISGDESGWQFTRGIHHNFVTLLEPDRLRKSPVAPVLSPAVSVRLTGKEFKDIVATASDLDKEGTIRCASDELTFSAVSTAKIPDTYTAILPADRCDLFADGASCTYTMELLQHAAADMRTADDVLFRFDTNIPCEVCYDHDGIKTGFMIAPRIDSE